MSKRLFCLTNFANAIFSPKKLKTMQSTSTTVIETINLLCMFGTQNKMYNELVRNRYETVFNCS